MEPSRLLKDVHGELVTVMSNHYALHNTCSLDVVRSIYIASSPYKSEIRQSTELLTPQHSQQRGGVGALSGTFSLLYFRPIADFRR